MTHNYFSSKRLPHGMLDFECSYVTPAIRNATDLHKAVVNYIDITGDLALIKFNPDVLYLKYSMPRERSEHLQLGNWDEELNCYNLTLFNDSIFRFREDKTRYYTIEGHLYTSITIGRCDHYVVKSSVHVAIREYIFSNNDVQQDFNTCQWNKHFDMQISSFPCGYCKGHYIFSRSDSWAQPAWYDGCTRGD